jgi:hypothetical protein
MLRSGLLSDVEPVENEFLPFRFTGRSAGGRDGTSSGARIIVGRMLGRDVGGRGGLVGGLPGVVALGVI